MITMKNINILISNVNFESLEYNGRLNHSKDT